MEYEAYEKGCTQSQCIHFSHYLVHCPLGPQSRSVKASRNWASLWGMVKVGKMLKERVVIGRIIWYVRKVFAWSLKQP